MKVEETAFFRVRLIESYPREEMLLKIKQFLKNNDWLDENYKRKKPLDYYHVEDNNVFTILLAHEKSDEDFIELINDLFNSLVEWEKVKLIKVAFNDNTSGIIYNNIDRFTKVQAIAIDEMREGDLMTVFVR